MWRHRHKFTAKNYAPEPMQDAADRCEFLEDLWRETDQPTWLFFLCDKSGHVESNKSKYREMCFRIVRELMWDEAPDDARHLAHDALAVARGDKTMDDLHHIMVRAHRAACRNDWRHPWQAIWHLCDRSVHSACLGVIISAVISVPGCGEKLCEIIRSAVDWYELGIDEG